jgi:hypothetical protein
VLEKSKEQRFATNTTIISSPAYSWVFAYVFEKQNLFQDYRDVLYHPIPTDNVLLIADNHFMWNMENEPNLQRLYNNTKSIAIFTGDVGKYDESKFPYKNMVFNHEGSLIDIRVTNWSTDP